VKTLCVGVGCRRGASAAQIARAVLHALGPRPMQQVRALASLDRKADETGLLAFSASHALPLLLFTGEDIDGIGAASNAVVHALIGVDGVCEPCALLASAGGRLVVRKTTLDGVSVAIAEDRQPHSNSTSDT
jgi:cobalt-precorrin 5A hydrolase